MSRAPAKDYADLGQAAATTRGNLGGSAGTNMTSASANFACMPCCKEEGSSIRGGGVSVNATVVRANNVAEQYAKPYVPPMLHSTTNMDTPPKSTQKALPGKTVEYSQRLAQRARQINYERSRQFEHEAQAHAAENPDLFPTVPPIPEEVESVSSSSFASFASAIEPSASLTPDSNSIYYDPIIH